MGKRVRNVWNFPPSVSVEIVKQCLLLQKTSAAFNEIARNCLWEDTKFKNSAQMWITCKPVLRERSDTRADLIDYSNRSLRNAAYRQFILWQYGKLGQGNRRVAPSCLVVKIQSDYPSENGLYMGFHQSQFTVHIRIFYVQSYFLTKYIAFLLFNALKYLSGSFFDSKKWVLELLLKWSLQTCTQLDIFLENDAMASCHVETLFKHDLVQKEDTDRVSKKLSKTSAMHSFFLKNRPFHEKPQNFCAGS